MFIITSSILFIYSFLITVLWRISKTENLKLKKILPSTTDLNLIKALNSGELSELDLKEMGILKQTKALTSDKKEEALNWLNELENQIKSPLKNPDELLKWNHIRNTISILNKKPFIVSQNELNNLINYYSNLLKFDQDEDLEWNSEWKKESRLKCYNLHTSAMKFIIKEKEKFL